MDELWPPGREGGPLPDGWPARSDVCLALNRMGGFDWDLDRDLLHLDASGLDVLDLAPDEFDSRPATLLARLPEQEAVRIDGVVRRALEDGSSSYGAYFRVRLRDGRMRWTHTQAHIVRDGRGTPHRIIGIVRDASEELGRVVAREELDERRRRHTSVVDRTAEALARAVTVRDVTDVLTASNGLRRLGAASLRFGLIENGRIHIVAEDRSPAPGLDNARLDEPLPMNEAVRSQRPVYISSAGEFAERFPLLWSHVAKLGVSAAAYLPLTAQGVPLGGLGLLFQEERDFPPEERNLLVAIGAGVAQSLQRAVLVEQEHDLAENLQHAMLPRGVPTVPGAAVAARYRSARFGRDIGGDWYDVIPLSDGRVAAVIGDVQGHDTHAATVMGQLRVVLRAFAIEGHPAPEVIARASVFLHDLDTDRFATCLYAEHDPASGRLSLVRAGHLAPLLRHADGVCEQLSVAGALPLGVATEFEQANPPVGEARLLPGETLLLYTDGLIEQPGRDLDEGVATLVDALGGGPDDLELLADTMTEVRGPGPDVDDMALVLLRRGETTEGKPPVGADTAAGRADPGLVRGVSRPTPYSPTRAPAG
ncbi:SpoIIE family protein phosphatase [Streptomyces hainanensis]|uniref:protein-serine/threonine phosphatase n=1 Tax=Streptomyces hainanensis TaxID=402648 RepID=A0A4R4TZ75_9ACTN|nr:SpoIIE family protein phosphatase [Streptomyces hainanensis]TDC79519.1 PAS domain S-box protein [Streptomyces hainanensis]